MAEMEMIHTSFLPCPYMANKFQTYLESISCHEAIALLRYVKHLKGQALDCNATDAILPGLTPPGGST